MTTKYLFGFLFVISLMFMGCRSDDTPPEEVPPEDPMQGELQEPAAGVEVSDDELVLFLDASVKIQEIQMEFQQEMVAIVEDEGIDVERYTQIAQGLQMGQTAEEMDVSDSEMENFEKASTAIEEVEVEMEEIMVDAIEEEGIDMNRFQEISFAIQQDPVLQQRIQEKLMEGPGQQPEES